MQRAVYCDCTSKQYFGYTLKSHSMQDVLEQRAAGAQEGASPATSSGKQPSPKEAAEQAIDQPELAVSYPRHSLAIPLGD